MMHAQADFFWAKVSKFDTQKLQNATKKHLEKSKSTKFMLQDYKFSYDYLSGIGEQKIASSAHCNECLRVIQDFWDQSLTPLDK